jgi:hypothetical protein
MPLNLKGLFSGGLKGLGDTAKNIIAQVAENKMTVAEADILLEKEVNRHTEAMEAAELKEMELQNANTASARTRETEYLKATGHADRMQAFVGILIMLSFFAGLIMIGFKAIPTGNEHIMINALGILEGLVLSVAGYYYGSSLGSRLKDKK